MIGLAASLLAVWCQIVLLATISFAPMAVAADPFGNIPICHANDGPQSTPGHPAHDCALCAICLAHALPMAIVSPTPSLPARQAVAPVRLSASHPRAPPFRPVAAAQPRGPPSLT